MTVRGHIAVLLLAIIAVIWPGAASVTRTPETRIGVFELRVPALIGFVATRTVATWKKQLPCERPTQAVARAAD